MLDDPTRPRNRLTKFTSGAGLDVEIRWPDERPRNRGKENLALASEPVVAQDDLAAIVAEIEALPRSPRLDGMTEMSKIIERHATKLGLDGWDLFYRVNAHSRELEAKRPRRRSKEEKAQADWERLSQFYRDLGKTT